MNKNSKKLGGFITLALLFAIAASVLRTIALCRDLESNMIYFKDQTLIYISYIIVIAGAFALLPSAFMLERVSLVSTFSSSSTYIPTGVVGVALVGFATELIMSISGDSLPSFFQSLGTPSAALALATAILALLSIAHFFTNALLGERHRATRGYFAIATIMMLTVYASMLYFDTSTPINASTKTVDQLAYLFAAIFFLYEARISLGREMWRGYSAFGLVALLIGVYSSLPAILAYFIKGYTVSRSLEASMLTLSISFFILMRLVLVTRLRHEGESAAMSSLRVSAEAREEMIRNGVNNIEDGVQLTIDDIVPTVSDDAASDDIAETITIIDEPMLESENDIAVE